jgi:hypothetical protein
MRPTTITVDEEDRQMLLRSLALNAAGAPGFAAFSREIAKKLHGAEMFDAFLAIFAPNTRREKTDNGTPPESH